MIGAHGAATVHRRLVEHTLAVVRESLLDFRVYTTGASLKLFRHWLGNDVSLIEQGEGDLGARLARASSPVLLIGGDAPAMTALHLQTAAAALASANVVVGPAVDGGYWLLGLRTAMPWLFDTMPWGTDQVLSLTLDRLAERQITPLLLERLDDIDRPEDLARWPQFYP